MVDSTEVDSFEFQSAQVPQQSRSPSDCRDIVHRRGHRPHRGCRILENRRWICHRGVDTLAICAWQKTPNPFACY